MNFFKLRILNTSLIFIIGILLGFIIKDKMFTAQDNRLSSVIQTEGETSASGLQSNSSALDEKNEYNVFDDDEDYDIPVPKKAAKKQNEINEEGKKPSEIEDKTAKFVDFSSPFFKNPAKFKNEIVTMDIQMIFARKSDSGWRLNLMYMDSQKGVKYVYLDSDLLVSDKINLKIGYFYRVYFKCTRGELNKGNILLSIAPTGKKADWATGISAIE
ncbi:MAG: hypothetical protein KAQ76_00170 [Elusimicrobiales bacterium]|nr:hypothetical protein [Elusimicrobiales bacterium]